VRPAAPQGVGGMPGASTGLQSPTVATSGLGTHSPG
jgi:hypothetical protein